MSLVGKKILVLGGNGYVGNYFASRLVKEAGTVSAMSRKGPKYEYPQNYKVQWLIGDILQPDRYLSQINAADIIIDTIGTLIDTSVTKGTASGGAGTYEQVNRDTLSSLLNHLKTPKKIIYLSSNAHPPFLPRYLSTKYEAENLLFSSIHEGYSLRPGFIHSSTYRKWSIPLDYGIKFWNKLYPYIHNIVPPQTWINKTLQQFKQGDTTSLEELGDALTELCVNGSDKKILQTGDIHHLSLKLRSQPKQSKKE